MGINMIAIFVLLIITMIAAFTSKIPFSAKILIILMLIAPELFEIAPNGSIGC
jgi:hypothetical protein